MFNNYFILIYVERKPLAKNVYCITIHFNPLTAKSEISRVKKMSKVSTTSRIVPEHCNGAKSRNATARAAHTRHQQLVRFILFFT